MQPDTLSNPKYHLNERKTDWNGCQNVFEWHPFDQYIHSIDPLSDWPTRRRLIYFPIPRTPRHMIMWKRPTAAPALPSIMFNEHTFDYG